MAQKSIITAPKLQFSSVPHGNHGDNVKEPTPTQGSKPRISLELTPPVLLLLDHVCEVMGCTKTQVINSALLDVLPALVERADFLSKRGQSLIQSGTAKKK